jgi:gluconate 2-dehydrogenase alpha chain
MTRRLPRKDVVIVGLGWTGSILAYELAEAGLDVVALERGPWRDTATDFNISTAPDELRYAVRQEIFLRPAQSTLTMRNTPDQRALPIRKYGSFLPGNGVGGAGVHWNGQNWRFLETDYVLKSHLTERYGEKALPENHLIQDWGVTYQDLEPYFDQFEKIAGISGKAGNLNGQKIAGGNPFEGPRSSEYPNPPLKKTAPEYLFETAANSLGLHPFPRPSANMSQAYTNPYGVRLGPCTYCGFCEWFGCANYSKSSPQTCILPALMRKPNFKVRPLCEVTRIDLTPDGKHVSGVTYVDSQNQEWEQPADLVILAAFQLFNVQLLLHSGIGKPYSYSTGEGVIGKNLAYQCLSGANGYFENAHMNPFAASGSTSTVVDDYNGDNFDHAGLGFVGGASITAGFANGRPIDYHPTLPGTPSWGPEWKKAVARDYNKFAGVGGQGSCMAYRDCFLDLDPTYKDRFGRPLLRMTFDYKPNDIKMAAYIADRCEDILTAMQPTRITGKTSSASPWNVVPYQTTHVTGGAIMGSDPTTSALNRYLQSWDAPNLFVMGASAFPQNAGYNPTGTVGGLACMAADAIRTQYLKNPGQPLVQA